jgi:transposase
MKFNELQVLFALMVTKDGLPIGYQAFNGATYEGHTLIPAIQTLKEKYKLDKVVFVADSGMMNTHNIEEMEGNGIEYIVGTRLKNLPKALKENVIDQSRYVEIRKGYKIAKFDYKGRSLIVSYSAKRARKDAKDRERAIEKIRKKVAKQKSPKDYLSNYGYKKYLKMEGETTIALDEDKIAADQRWDGLLGVSTNAPHLSSEEVLEKYRELWQVEEAFRINKHDLKMRPVFHWKPSRVRAHIAIAFLAFSLVKYLEYRVKLQYKKLSPEIIRQTLIRVQTSILFDKTKRIRYALPSKMSRDARKIYGLMNLSKTCTPYILEKL